MVGVWVSSGCRKKGHNSMPQNMKNVSSHGSGDQESGMKVLEGSVHAGFFTPVPPASCH